MRLRSPGGANRWVCSPTPCTDAPGAATHGERGYTLAEALITLILLTILLQAAWSVTAGHTRGAAELVRRSEMLEAVRISGWTLREELKSSRPGTDWLADDDSIALRAYRGLAVPCPGASAPGVVVADWVGVREPEPEKDSLLLLEPDGQWRAYGLNRVARVPPCAGGGPTLRLELDDPEAGGYLARVFERGTYHVADAALRYRRGLGGRQPMTPRALAEESGLERLGGEGVVVHLRANREAGAAAAWAASIRLWGHGPP